MKQNKIREGLSRLFSTIIFLGIIAILIFSNNTNNVPSNLDNETEENISDEIAAEETAITTTTYYIKNNYPIELSQWKSLPVHYYFSDETYCGDYYKERMVKAFRLIEKKTDYAVTFYEEEGSNAIKIVCENKEENDIDGVAYALTYTEGEEITSAEVHLYKTNNHKYIQNGIEVETHEILHTLGFDHITGKESIMNPIGHDYDIEIDKEIIDCIKYVYAKDNNYSCENYLSIKG